MIANGHATFVNSIGALVLQLKGQNSDFSR
jgi:hypothetical protein